jgi:hypothetical protein
MLQRPTVDIARAGRKHPMEDISKVAWAWFGVLLAICLIGAFGNYVPKLFVKMLMFLN